MNWLIAGCHCCQGFAFHIFCGATTGSALSDNDRYDVGAGTWSSLTNAVSPTRFFCQSFTITDTAYVCCGQSGGALSDNDSYTVDSWTSKTSCTAAANYLIPGAVAGNGYTIHQDGSNFEYSPGGDSWSTQATRTPYANRSQPTGFTIGDGVYSATGLTAGTSKETDKYEPSGDSWTSKSDHLTAKQQASGMTIGGKGYVFSGLNTTGDGTGEWDDLDEYDPSGDSWTSKAANVAGAPNGMACGFNSEGFAVGGYRTVVGVVTFYDYNSSYTPGSDTWDSASPTPTPSRGASACSSL